MNNNYSFFRTTYWTPYLSGLLIIDEETVMILLVFTQSVKAGVNRINVT